MNFFSAGRKTLLKTMQLEGMDRQDIDKYRKYFEGVGGLMEELFGGQVSRYIVYTISVVFGYLPSSSERVQVSSWTNPIPMISI